MRRSTPFLSERLDLVAFFAALCLLLSTVEYLIPKPMPFLRLGLANLPILLALDAFPLPYILLLILLKVLGQGLVAGTLFSYVFLFSLAGSLSSGLVMIGSFRLLGRSISLIGVSVLGALASNIAQLVLAALLVFGRGAWLMGPPFLALGTAAGLLVGLFARKFAETSHWLRLVREAAR